MGEGGVPHYYLEKIAEKYPLSFHGVGLSLGSAEGLDRDHLARLKTLAVRYQPALMSEHLSWSIAGGLYLNDLLPLPYTAESLQIVCTNIAQAQDFLERTLLIENPSTYFQFAQNEMTEQEFLAEMVKISGCGLLLDINNIYVSAFNHGLDPDLYLEALQPKSVQEIHLAGHVFKEKENIRIDDHGSRVCPDVWSLYEKAIQKFGPVPTLIEWDTNVPDFSVLQHEADKANYILESHATRFSDPS